MDLAQTLSSPVAGSSSASSNFAGGFDGGPDKRPMSIKEEPGLPGQPILNVPPAAQQHQVPLLTAASPTGRGQAPQPPTRRR